MGLKKEEIIKAYEKAQQSAITEIGDGFGVYFQRGSSLIESLADESKEHCEVDGGHYFKYEDPEHETFSTANSLNIEAAKNEDWDGKEWDGPYFEDEIFITTDTGEIVDTVRDIDDAFETLSDYMEEEDEEEV